MAGILTFVKGLSIGRSRPSDGADSGASEVAARLGDPAFGGHGLSAPTQDAVRLAAALGASAGQTQWVVTFAATGKGGHAGEVAAQVAAALAAAEAGPLLLIDADPADPGAPARPGATRGRGLADLIEGSASADEVIQRSGIPGLSIVPPGESRPNYGSLLLSPQCAEWLKSLRDLFRVVLIHSPPVLGGSCAPLLVRNADRTVLVVSEGQRRRDLIEARHVLGAMGVKDLLVIINRAASRPGSRLEA